MSEGFEREGCHDNGHNDVEGCADVDWDRGVSLCSSISLAMDH